ncbi:MAG: choice-of-anchor Q domain-containing protein [Lysobacterales bacterium]
MTNAVDGDTIDMTALTCSTITLTTGALHAYRNDLTLVGPGSKYLSISGNGASQILGHIGDGTLNVSGVTIEDGRKYGAHPRGGCIYSGGDVRLDDVVMAYCSAAARPGYTYPALGGAVYVYGDLTLDHFALIEHSSASSADTSASGGGAFVVGNVTLRQSFMLYNTAVSGSNSTNGRDAYGGGIYAFGTVTLTNASAISHNEATSEHGYAKGGGSYSKGGFYIVDGTVSDNAVTAPAYALAGGVFARDDSIIRYSTIADNYSSHNVGGVAIDVAYGLSIIESTISGNVAGNVIGGVFSAAPTTIENSTIAFNTSTHDGYGDYGYHAAAGIDVHDQPLTLQSTIIAQNTNSQYPGNPWSDLGGPNGTTVTGANNLVRHSYIPVPADTIENTDPMLLPLADNGGLTETHALSDVSPAIDAGNKYGGFSYDQRGAPYWRVVGANADIGAFEGVSSDEIFGNGFD